LTDVILDTNAAAQRLFGLSAADFSGLRAPDLIAAAEPRRARQGERRSNDRPRLQSYRRKDGTVFPADEHTAFVMIGNRPCHLWMVRDATERLRNDAAGERAKAQESFVGKVVHELRTPITVIKGSVETLSRGVRSAQTRTMMLKFIDNHAVRMTHLVDRLLDLSAADSSERKSTPSMVPLAEAVREIASAFLPLAKRRHISLKVDVPADLRILADPGDLPHIVGNLLENALKFTPKGGQIFVRGRAEDGRGLLSIRDTGGGLAPEDLSRIFDPFYRSDRTRRTKGTGLGLAIVQGMVKANNGRITADNAPSGGAVFEVSLPLAKTLP
jgi:PAS domain S-box-containing protein